MALKSDMLRAFGDGKEDSPIKDVTLVGSDGGRVSATKAVLGIRSKVFERMFFGNFQESSDNSNEIQMDYPTVVLQMVVKYCYTDELDFDLLYEETRYITGLTDKEAVAMVQARDAANYLELFDLHRNLSNALGEHILPIPVSKQGEHTYHTGARGDMACICAILQELMVRGGSDGPLWGTCMDLVKPFPEVCLLPQSTGHNQGILACSLGLLASIFESIELDAFVAVKALKKWNQGKKLDEEEKVKAQKIADKIQLESISTANLAELEPCSLFSMESLYKAFVHHCKGQSRTASSPLPNNPSNALDAVVQGASIECVNGVYSYNNDYNYFMRVGKYGKRNLVSEFRIIRKEKESRWQIVVLPGSNHSKPLVLYEATINSRTGSVDRLPFALWKCGVDVWNNTDPGCTPYVMVLLGKPSIVVPSSTPSSTSAFSFNGAAASRPSSNFHFGAR